MRIFGAFYEKWKEIAKIKWVDNERCCREYYVAELKQNNQKIIGSTQIVQYKLIEELKTIKQHLHNVDMDSIKSTKKQLDGIIMNE